MGHLASSGKKLICDSWNYEGQSGKDAKQESTIPKSDRFILLPAAAGMFVLSLVPNVWHRYLVFLIFSNN